ncbi:glycosyltransferase [bacterium]|nr:glycosyltransferase [bacterium]
MKSIRASLFVTTYEMPQHLRLVLAGLERQSTTEFELILCDDGSSEETGKIISEFKSTAPFPVLHVWQEHHGFRKCKILNEGLRQSCGETLIFLDGDCVPHRDYVRDHLEQQESGFYLAGRRVELGKKISSTLKPQQIRNGFFDFPRPSLIWSALTGDSEFIQRSVRVTNPLLREKLGMGRVADLKGCNYSVARKDLLAINGFDEDYEGYGREDTDVEIRLQNLGLKIKSLKGLALQFHVWHPRREFTPKNDNRLEELQKSGRITCGHGLKQL